MGVYVVGDIHGCFDDWVQLKNKIEAQDKHAKFILVGDIIDRGPNSIDMLRWAMKHVTKHGKYQMVLGNHEYEKYFWLESFFKAKKEKPELEVKEFMADNYDFKASVVKAKLELEELVNIRDWIEDLELYKEVTVNTEFKRRQRYLIVHGGLKYNQLGRDKGKVVLDKYLIPLSGLRRIHSEITEKMVWERNYHGYYNAMDLIIINGHTPTDTMDALCRGSVPGRPWYLPNNIDIDTGAVFRHYGERFCNLCAIRLQDLKEFYSYDKTEEELEGEKESYGYIRNKHGRGTLMEILQYGCTEITWE